MVSCFHGLRDLFFILKLYFKATSDRVNHETMKPFNHETMKPFNHVTPFSLFQYFSKFRFCPTVLRF